jgi:hypothetical protein
MQVDRTEIRRGASRKGDVHVKENRGGKGDRDERRTREQRTSCREEIA